MGLGINKELEPLVREVRRAGGSVEVTRSNQVRWVMPDGSEKRTGLTMNSRSARNAERDLRAALLASTTTEAAPSSSPAWVCEPNGRGKFHLIDSDGIAMRNASGFPRTFSSRDEALRTAQLAQDCARALPRHQTKTVRAKDQHLVDRAQLM